ncbi:hypothetical protein D9M68_325410 [compost metagenome]
MTRPQLPIEEIDLIPHPMDAWRAALDILIACAPGDASALAWHLVDAQVQNQDQIDRTPATAGAAVLVDRLMLLGAGQLVGDQTNAADPHALSCQEAHVISRHLLAHATRLSAAHQQETGAGFATQGRAVPSRAAPDHWPVLADPAQRPVPVDVPTPHRQNASTHQESGDRG